MAARYNQRKNTVPLRGSSKSSYTRYPVVGSANSQPMGNSSTEYSRNSAAYSTKAQKKTKKSTKIAIGVLCTLLVMLVGGGTAFAMYINSVNESLSSGKTEEEQTAISEALVEVTEYSDPFYIMLLGSDARSDNSEMGQRADTNILVRVDPENAQISMLSIPRDTKIELEGYGTNKFNAAYSYGGTALAISEASKLCGVDIAHYAEVNFEELISLVDAIGGIEVDVPELVDDPQAGPVVIQPGPQTLDGQSALTFARTRQFADGDFTRTSNQRLVVEAIIEKVLSLPINELPDVISKGAKSVTTDLTIDQLLDIAMQFKDFSKLTIYSAMVPSTTAYIGEISYVLCITDALADMMKLIEAGEDPNTLDLTNYNAPSGDNSSSSTYNNNSYTDDSYNYDPGYSAPQTTPDTGYVPETPIDPGAGDGGGEGGGVVEPPLTEAA